MNTMCVIKILCFFSGLPVFIFIDFSAEVTAVEVWINVKKFLQKNNNIKTDKLDAICE